MEGSENETTVMKVESEIGDETSVPEPGKELFGYKWKFVQLQRELLAKNQILQSENQELKSKDEA